MEPFAEISNHVYWITTAVENKNAKWFTYEETDMYRYVRLEIEKLRATLDEGQ